MSNKDELQFELQTLDEIKKDVKSAILEKILKARETEDGVDLVVAIQAMLYFSIAEIAEIFPETTNIVMLDGKKTSLLQQSALDVVNTIHEDE